MDCIDSAFGNAGKRFVEGLDLTAVYELPTERWGKFTFSGGYNHFFSWKAQPGTGQPFNSFLGNYNNGTLPLAPGAIPWNKGFLRGEWEWRHFDFVATGNYVGDFRDDPAFDTIARTERRNVPSYITLDMQLSYEWVKPPSEPAPYVKESKDSEEHPSCDRSRDGVDLAADAVGHQAHGRRERRVRPSAAIGDRGVQRQLRYLALLDP